MGTPRTPEQKARREAYLVEYRRKNKAARCEYNQEYRRKNSAEIAVKSKQRREENKEWWDNYYRLNRDKKLQAANEHYRKNKRSVIVKAKERYHSDIQFRITKNLRGRLADAMKSKGAMKSKRTLALIGCTALELMRHLESLFVEGMTWENYGNKEGNWVMDHILPCASFDLTNPAEQKKCFHFANIQPLWLEENAQKGDRLDWVRGAVILKQPACEQASRASPIVRQLSLPFD